MQSLPWEIGSLGCRFHYFGLCFPSKQSHYYGTQLKAGILQESVSPVQSFVADTCLIPIVITKGLQKQTFHPDIRVVEAVYVLI